MSKYIDKQWPIPTAEQRAEYMKRRELERNKPVPAIAWIGVSMAFAAIPVIYWWLS